MLLKELVEGINIRNIFGNQNIEISGIAFDSRKVRKGFLFVCIEGFKVDGHQFIQTALENGAVALLVQKKVDVPEDITVVEIEDTRYGLAYVADKFFSHPSGKFNLIGVTGTKGKTTTTHMIKSVLEEAGELVGLIGTIANRIGNQILPAERTTPESYDLQALFDEMNSKGVNSVVMEVSSQGLELHRVSCTEFNIGVFTNFSQDHIGPNEHATMEDYFNAKLKLFKMCNQAVVNIDSPYGKRVVEACACKTITYGIENTADVLATNIITHQDSVDFDVSSPWGSSRMKVNVPGLFSVYNALCCIGVCGLLGISLETIAKGLVNVSVPGRAEVIVANEKFTVMNDYAHTPDSLENILKTVKGFAKGRTVSIFGCGGDRDKTKRPMMGEISGNIADFTIITSDNPRTEDPESIVKDIEKGILKTSGEYITIVDRREAIKYAIKNAKKDDVILLAGKGHETYQIFKDKTVRFDEREVVAEILEELLKEEN